MREGQTATPYPGSHAKKEKKILMGLCTGTRIELFLLDPGLEPLQQHSVEIILGRYDEPAAGL